ncbi:bifunctional metallophosphatase/5'-nucleotidase [Halalkalibacter krulwichiae]|uniref:Endonuclease YhcR n=1 Tax=Halalkalibacter krulwichiae TaxID=199441 RepID=A0A1X9MFM2_9BACI|nr:5'-nucleotidase C-terminal domain-containing protein [Halalkalibacter krulwichiae]ARK32255.1 Endonuclease YhcR precursor [Halalkalibacter krulwichiae]
MKKALSLLLASSMLLSMAGCNADNQTTEPLGQPEAQMSEHRYQPLSPTNNRNEERGRQGLSDERHGHISERPEPNNRGRKKAPINPQYRQIQLLGINDLHGQLNVTRQVNGRAAGRADYLAAYLKERAKNNKNTIFVHAGDMVGASPPVSALLKDEPTIEFLNTMNMDVGTVGNHEFDQGLDELLRLAHGGNHPDTGDFEGSDFPWLAANVIDDSSGEPILPRYKVIKRNGIDIGFIGVVTTDTPNLVIPSGVRGLSFIDEVDAINDAVDELKRQGVKSIIVLAHNPGTSNANGDQAVGELVEMANNVDDEVDIIFGGHNHAYMNAVVDDKLLIQSYSYATAFSDVLIEVDPRTKDIVNKSAEIVTVFQDDIEPDAEISRMIGQYEEKVEPIVNEIVASTNMRLTGQQNENGESILGNLIADSQRAAMDADFAFMNPGGIRADIDEGDVTWGNLYVVQPFNNTLVKMNLSGEQIRQALNQQWQPNATRMLQISGLYYTWDANQAPGEKVLNIQLPDGTDLDPNETYSVVVNSFLADGGDSFTAFRDGTDRETGPVDLDALVDFIKTLPQPFSYEIQDRIQKVQY